MTLRFLSSEIVHMDRSTFMWIQVTAFALDLGLSDRKVISALISSPEYAHDYASPFDAHSAIKEPAVHGRWMRSSITVESFVPCTAASAEDRLHSWATEQEWTEQSSPRPLEVRQRLHGVCTLLRAGTLYELRNPGADQEHEYGFVTGSMGFHELLVIDRNAHCVYIVVASDD